MIKLSESRVLSYGCVLGADRTWGWSFYLFGDYFGLLEVYGSHISRLWGTWRLLLTSWMVFLHSFLCLNHWMRRIKCLIGEFTCINFRHIYREYNIEANCLSKLLIGAMDGFLFVEEYIDGFLFASGSLNLFW